MAFSSLTALKNSRKFRYEFAKRNTASNASNQWTSLWFTEGIPGIESAPAAGSASADSGGTARTNAGIYFPDSTSTKYFTTIQMLANASVSVAFYDRVVDVGGISVTTTGLKNVNSVPLGRYTGADSYQIQPWLEVTTAVTGTLTANIRYTNQSGTTGRQGGNVTMVAPGLNAMYPMPLQAGDRGLRSIQSFDVVAAGSAGAVSLVLLRRFETLNILSAYWSERDFIPKLRPVLNGASIGMMFIGVSTATPVISGSIFVTY